MKLDPSVGSSIHEEYWIPAEDLAEFNENIIGEIEVVAEYGHDALNQAE